MDQTTNSINWFEIPALDIKRAKQFYETVFNITMEDVEMGDDLMAFFPWTPGSGKANGSIVQGEGYTPSTTGTVVYMNANPAMDDVLSRVEAAGGQVAVKKSNIGEHGHIAIIIDTEGNKIGIHSIG